MHEMHAAHRHDGGRAGGPLSNAALQRSGTTEGRSHTRRAMLHSSLHTQAGPEG